MIALIAGWEAAAAWRRRLHQHAELSRHRWLWRLIAGLAASLATTLIASVATGAFAAYHFNRIPFSAWSPICSACRSPASASCPGA